MDSQEKFKEDIYKYCDNNIGGRVLFTGFMNLWSQLNHDIAPKHLATLTSEIINELTKKGILKEVPKKFECFYGMYEILPHEKILVTGKCPSCFEESEFEYVGEQETFRDPFYMYNCKKCNTTHSLESIVSV